MTSAWLSGFFAAVGALIGAGATLSSGLITNRAQQRLAAETRTAQVADVRRAAYGDYLTAVYSFMDRSREVIAMIENDVSTTECHAAHRAYLEEWDHLQGAYAPVIIAGPSEIEGSAEALRSCLALLADQCDEFYKAYMNGQKGDQTGRYDT